jgi:hypothetical protein
VLGIPLPRIRQQVRMFLGRSTVAILPRDFHMGIYVDDPAFAATGAPEDIITNLAITLLLASVLGYPLAWRKSDGGQSFPWIGASIAVELSGVRVSFAADKLTRQRRQTHWLLSLSLRSAE